MLTGDQALTDFIRRTIRERGPVSFAWFMEQALYHPEFGYYSSGRCQIGRRGDYFTNVSVGPLFGRLLAAQFAEMWEILGRPGDFTIVEQGAHHGEFAGDVLEEVRGRTPDFFSSLRYCVIEPFPILEARQRERLRDFTQKLTWTKSLSDLEPFIGVHFSNELLDSMPVRLISRESGEDWKERLVKRAGDGFALVTGPIADEKLRQHLEKVPRPGDALYETEVNLLACDWIEDVARKIACGFVLAVDYGYPRDQFYAAERTSGTLQCYAGHRVRSPLTEAGASDITAHVDWTSVAERAEKCGLSPLGFADQHHFITGLLSGPAQVEVAEENGRRTGRALTILLHPEFLGTSFQFLVLATNTPAVSLSGLRFARDVRAELGLKQQPP
jgi:SAM-dependent MidA family methyltransferase